MRFACLLLVLALAPSTVSAQSDPDRTVASVIEAFEDAAALADASARTTAVDSVWADLRQHARIPFVHADTALFLWKGSASTVAVAGDATSWRPTATMRRIGTSDVWMRTDVFPASARLDYKLVLNGSSWILDPRNPHQQWSGFGPNSELRMPEWMPSEWTERKDGVPRGTLSRPMTIQSTAYPHAVTYRVWMPAGYDTMDELAAVYVTDGHEYADDRLGAMQPVLDNLIAEGRMAPCVVVFIDPRSGGTNRRQEQYVQNPGFATLVAVDLVSAVDAAYKTRQDREARTILGTSLGGLFAVYLGLEHPDVFGNLAPQSPAFWVSSGSLGWTGPTLYDRVSSSPTLPFTVAMTTGTINDTEDGARTMRDTLLARGVELAYTEVAEGHSWGNWRALLDDILTALVPPEGPTYRQLEAPDTGLLLRALPNPSSAPELHFALQRPSAARLDCFDARGRSVGRLLDASIAPGQHRVSLPNLPSGVYACRLTADQQSATTLVTTLN
ncbi:MAG: alpha/beta hydrolase-fold protein [Bacteroidota bacterium]